MAGGTENKERKKRSMRRPCRKLNAERTRGAKVRREAGRKGPILKGKGDGTWIMEKEKTCRNKTDLGQRRPKTKLNVGLNPDASHCKRISLSA